MLAPKHLDSVVLSIMIAEAARILRTPVLPFNWADSMEEEDRRAREDSALSTPGAHVHVLMQSWCHSEVCPWNKCPC